MIKVVLKVDLPLPLFSAKTCEGVDWKCPKFTFSSATSRYRCQLFSTELKADPKGKKIYRCSACLKAEKAYNNLKKIVD